MVLEQPRPGVFTATMTVHEMSALVAGARLSLSVMQADPTGGSAEARQALERVLDDLDRALERLMAAQRG